MQAIVSRHNGVLEAGDDNQGNRELCAVLQIKPAQVEAWHDRQVQNPNSRMRQVGDQQGAKWNLFCWADIDAFE